MNVRPTFITIGETPLPSIPLNVSRPPAGQTLVDTFRMQNFQKWGVGESGICVGGVNEGWMTKIDNKYVVNLPRYCDWIRTLSPTDRYISLDIEPNYGEFDYFSESTTRAFRMLHAAALEIRPNLIFSDYILAGLMPGNPRGLVADAEQLALIQKLCYGTTDSGSPIRTRGMLDANHVVSGQFYPGPATTFDEIDEQMEYFAACILPIISTYQKPGIWVSPLGEPRPNEFGANLNKPLPAAMMAHIGGSARRAGLKVLYFWGYQTDETGYASPAMSTEERDKARAYTWNEVWKPVFEACANAFL